MLTACLNIHHGYGKAACEAYTLQPHCVDSQPTASSQYGCWHAQWAE